MGIHRNIRYAGGLVLLTAVLCGCGGSQAADEKEEIQNAEQYGKLPGLKASTNKALRDELSRIREERGTPAQLNSTGVAKANNVAELLAAVFSLKEFSNDQVFSKLQESEQIFPPNPPGRFAFDPVRMEKAQKFRDKFQAQLNQARLALKRPQCDFGIQFLAGAEADTRFIDVVRICGRLEAFQAAEALFVKHNPRDAVVSFQNMLRLASCLGAEKHVASRLEAAYLRTEAFVVLQAVVLDENCSRKNLMQAADVVQKHMKTWPPDANAWIGDRAEGMHVYEMARDGNLPLTGREIEQLREEELLMSVQIVSPERIDRDEFYYLQMMRKIIAGCKQPYYVRVEILDEIADDLHRQRATYDFPTIAARILWPKIRKAHAIQAQDRANWEAWSIALAMATRRDPPPYEFNPLTGKKYVKKTYPDQRGRTEIVVSNFCSDAKGEEDPEIRVPHISG